MNVHAVEVDRRSEKRLIAGFHALYSLGSVVGALAMATLLNVGIGLLLPQAFGCCFVSLFGDSRSIPFYLTQVKLKVYPNLLFGQEVSCFGWG